VCLSVHEDICRITHAIFTRFFVYVAYGHGSVFFQQGDDMPRAKGNVVVFFPVDNALYSMAFGTHTKTAEPIEMPFGMMSGLGPRNSVLLGGDDSQRGRDNFGVKRV